MKTKRFMQFFAPADAGTSAAPLDGPIADATTIDPLTYEPPAGEDILKYVEGADDAKPPEGTVKPAPVAKPDAKPEDTNKPADDKKPAADKKPADDKKPDATKTADDKSPAAQMRARIEELQTKNSDLEKQLGAAKSDTRVAELTKRIEENDKALASARAEQEQTQRKLLAHNPMVSKRLQDMRDAFNKEYAAAVELVPEMKGEYQHLLNEFGALPRDGADYADKLKAFRAKLKETYGDDTATVLDAIRKGHEFRKNHAAAADEVQRDAEKILFEAEREKWDTSNKRLESDYDKFFEPPADAATSDPLNTKLFMQNFEKDFVEPGEAKRVNTAIKAYVGEIFNGLRPRTPADFPGMDEKAAKGEMDKMNAAMAEKLALAPEVVATCMKFAAYGRALIAQNAQYREELAKYRKATPPDPTKKTGDDKKPAEGSTANLDEIQMPSADEIAASIGE